MLGGYRLIVQNKKFIAPGKQFISKIVNLEGKYVLPGFAEAHHHMVYCNSDVIEQFLKANMVYAAILNTQLSSRLCEKKYHQQDSLEIINAYAGFSV